MNITELDSYNLADAIKFNDRLNPRLWDEKEHLRPEVRDQLLKIADDFREFLGVTDIELKDITISGSNATYTYTPHSDIDLHLVVDLPTADRDQVYRELFDAKKYQYNDEHNIHIGNADVELYVENANQPPKSQGIYSVLNNQWIQVPRRGRADIDDNSTKNKYHTLSRQIQAAIKSGSVEKISNLISKIKKMRQASLDQHGEFGSENLAFKMLRSQGAIADLFAARNRAKDQALSLDEQKPKQRFVYGFKQVREASSPDGVSPETKMVVSEDPPSIDDEAVLQDFVDFCVKELKIDQLPTIKLRRDPQWSVVHRTFGRYVDDRNLLEVAWGQRHLMDVLRTVAHELTHRHQHERDGDRMGPEAGETGSKWENEANARAGVLMRDYGRLHPELFDAGQAHDLNEGLSWSSLDQGLSVEDKMAIFEEYAIKGNLPESASGYIPTKRQARDPRYSTALTQDVRPGQLGREANKLRLKTDSQGHPQLARTNGLFEQLMTELHQFKTLDEVNMSPTILRQFANTELGKKMLAGFEAELIFTDANEVDDPEFEDDMDYDRAVDSIDDVIDFFNEGEYGGLSARQRDRLRSDLKSRFDEWVADQIYDEFYDSGPELIQDLLLQEMSMYERIHAQLTANLSLNDDEADEIMEFHDSRAGGKIKGSEMSEQQLEMSSQFSMARSLAEEQLAEEVESSMDHHDSYYLDALEGFKNDFDTPNQRDFFRSQNLGNMSDIAGEFGLPWPYMREIENDDEGEYSYDSAQNLANSLKQDLGVETAVSGGRYDIERDMTTWIFEPDPSISPNNPSDLPVEIVSPPMTLSECLKKLDEFFDWAKRHDAYANRSTGFHMSVSIPEIETADVDFVKLALFLGDQHVLEQFARATNHFCESVLEKIKQRARYLKQIDVDRIFHQMKSRMLEMAHKAIANNAGFGKYYSINPKGTYTEFRSAGNRDYFKDTDKLKNTLLRYARAFSIAADPAAEREEYAKKLYKLLDRSQKSSVLDLFAKYSAGAISQDELKKFWSTWVLGQSPEWEAYDMGTNEPLGHRIKATDETEAVDIFRRQGLDHFYIKPVSQNARRADLVRRMTQSLDKKQADAAATNANTVNANRIPRDWEFILDGQVIDRVSDINLMQANAVRDYLAVRRNVTPAMIAMRTVPSEQSAARARAARDTALGNITNTDLLGPESDPATNESIKLAESIRWPDIESAKRAFVANPRFKHLPVSKREAMGAAAYIKQQSRSSNLIDQLKTPPTRSWHDIDEAFDQPYRLFWEKGEFGDLDAYTTLPDGTNLDIMFNREGDDSYTIEFWRNYTQDASGRGDSQRIFATVLSAIQKFLRKKQPKYISFTAGRTDGNQDSRVSLYTKLLRRYANNWGYTVRNVFDKGPSVTFDLVKIKPDDSSQKSVPLDEVVIDNQDLDKDTQQTKAQEFIDKVYDMFPDWPYGKGDKVMVWGKGKDQQFAVFALKTKLGRPDTVEIDWFQAHPLRQGVGSRAMAELQRLAKEHGVKLALWPWDKGQISQGALKKFYKKTGFKPIAKNANSMEWEPLDEVVIDNQYGAGATPNNSNVDYKGLRVAMRPSTFLQLAAPLTTELDPKFTRYIADGGAIASPFLEVVIPEAWDSGDFSQPAKVAGHEGRNRMTAILKLEGDNPVEVHIFPRYYRARDMTPEFVSNLNRHLQVEKSRYVKQGPLFTSLSNIEEGLDRRGFLKNLGVAAAAGATGYGIGKRTRPENTARPDGLESTTDPSYIWWYCDALKKWLPPAGQQAFGKYPEPPKTYSDQDAKAQKTAYHDAGAFIANSVLAHGAENPESDQAIRKRAIQALKMLMKTDYPVKESVDQGVTENFADGKGPGRPGDSQRHGIPKHATMAELERASKSKGRKGQLARWQLNMRRGKKK